MPSVFRSIKAATFKHCGGVSGLALAKHVLNRTRFHREPSRLMAELPDVTMTLLIIQALLATSINIPPPPRPIGNALVARMKLPRMRIGCSGGVVTPSQ